MELLTRAGVFLHHHRCVNSIMTKPLRAAVDLPALLETFYACPLFPTQYYYILAFLAATRFSNWFFWF